MLGRFAMWVIGLVDQGVPVENVEVQSDGIHIDAIGIDGEVKTGVITSEKDAAWFEHNLGYDGDPGVDLNLDLSE